MTYTYHIDVGHGWLEVPYTDFRKAGLNLKQVQKYSYAHVKNYKPTLYLEEDCHMPLFINAMEAQGEVVEIVTEHHGPKHCFIRDLGVIQ